MDSASDVKRKTCPECLGDGSFCDWCGDRVSLCRCETTGHGDFRCEGCKGTGRVKGTVESNRSLKAPVSISNDAVERACKALEFANAAAGEGLYFSNAPDPSDFIVEDWEADCAALRALVSVKAGD